MNRHLSRLVAMVRRWRDGDARDRTLDAELDSFVQHDIDARIESGMTPAEARRTALASIGGLQQVREHAREARTGARIEELVGDVRYAIRSVRRSPGLSLAIVGSLAVGIAVTVVACAFTNAWLFKPFPGVSEQERMFTVEIRRRPNNRSSETPMDSNSDYLALQQGLATTGDLAALAVQSVAVQLPEPRSVLGLLVSTNYFSVLGAHAVLGRTFQVDDGQPENAAVAVISHRLWRLMNGDASVIGRSIRVGGRLVEVIGVASPGFGGTSIRLGGRAPDIWLPLALANGVSSDPAITLRAETLRFVVKAKPGVDAAAILAAARVVAAQQAAALSQPGTAAVSDVSMVDSAFKARATLTMMTIPVLVLVIACVNAASLTLARGSRQRRDVALRLAIGAERGRVVRHLLMESLVLAFAATLVALPLASVVLSAAAGRWSLPMPIDATVVALTLLAATISAIASGLVPAFRVTAKAPLQALSVSRAATVTPSDSGGRYRMVAAQIALSIGVLITGTQLITMVEGQGGTAGTPADRLLMASFDLDQLSLSPDAATSFYQHLIEDASRLPGVQAVGLARTTAVWTFNRGKAPGSVVVWAPGRQPEVVIGGYAGGDLFGAVGLKLLAGRGFQPDDRIGPARVAIVNQTYAQELGEGRAIGQTIRVATWRPPGNKEALAEAREVTIIGVVESAGEKRYSQDGSPVAKLYVPSPLGPERALTLYIRTLHDASDLMPAVRDLVTRINPHVPIDNLGSLASSNERAMGPTYWLTRMAALLGVIALALAAAGLLATASYVVTQRARELAVHITLGAQPSAVLRLVLLRSMQAVGFGFTIGGAIALAISRLIATRFHGATGFDVVAFAQVTTLLVAVTLAASLIPALRAARIDPIAALKDG